MNCHKKDLIQTWIEVLKKYPLLTTRKQCQLKFTNFGSHTNIFSAFTSSCYRPNDINRNIKSQSAISVKSFCTRTLLNISNSGNTSFLSLHPWFVTGLSNGECIFGLSVYKKSNSKGLHKKDRTVLEKN